jgi:Protein of unknown function (DUF1194)
MPNAVTRRVAVLGGAALSVATAASAQVDTEVSLGVDLQLVLAVDTSGSVTPRRFDLQRDGYAAAFRQRDVQRVVASGRLGAIAVVMTHWTGQYLQRIAVPWTRLSSPETVAAFGDAIEAAPRQLYAGGTSISGAIDHARQLLSQCPFKGADARQVRRVIDISGDGENNRGRPPAVARDEAVALEITINGLPILAIDPELDSYYLEQVIGGTTAFVIPTGSFETFGEAVRRKLVQEIAAVPMSGAVTL